MLIAAVQMEAVVADVDANLAACERLAADAGAQGAQAIALPEFFSTGIGFVPALADAALPPDGAATEMLRRIATRHNALVGGSFLCRDADGEVRNAYLLVRPDGSIAGRHDKDLPTMWENAFYVGGHDDGVIEVDENLTVGAAVCWELMRTQTVRRLRGRVDLVMTGSGWWSVPRRWGPGPLMDRLEERNCATARRSAESFARYVGAPVVHAAHAGDLECATPWWPIGYDGHFEGATDQSARPTEPCSPRATRARVRESWWPRSSRAGNSRRRNRRASSGCTAVARSRRSRGTSSAPTGGAGTAAT